MFSRTIKYTCGDEFVYLGIPRFLPPHSLTPKFGDSGGKSNARKKEVCCIKENSVVDP
jgi:hypothetical protein